MRLLLIMVVALTAMTDAEASIVNDPVALSAKLEEMRFQRELKHERTERYWELYRELPAKQVSKKVCSKIYTTKGVRNNCRYELREVKDDSSIRHLLRR